MSMPNSLPSQPPDLGKLGEDFVAHWLESKKYRILKRRWTCRLGELDLVVESEDRTIALVEVKTRSAGNWDLDGLLAISATKRNKLWKTAELFLVAHPSLATRAIRFDVALVRCGGGANRGLFVQTIEDYPLSLQDYLENAFSL